MDRPLWRFTANYRLHRRLQIAIPAMYLLDRESQIVAQWVGKIDYDEVEKEVLKRFTQFHTPQ